MGVLLILGSGWISTPLAAAILKSVFCTKKSIIMRIRKTKASAPRIMVLLRLEPADCVATAPAVAAAATGAGGV